MIGREHFVELGVGFRSQPVHEAPQIRVPRAALRAVGEMLGRRRIERLAGPLGEVALEQPIVVKVVRANDHDLPPSSARSFRAARNRCTRTVDSFRPVIALTSRGVQSP